MFTLQELDILSPPDVDLRPNAEIVADRLMCRAVTSERNVWAFWDKGFENMPSYLQRNVMNWARLMPTWSIRVVDMVEGSANNVFNFIKPSDTPVCFQEKSMTGRYAPVSFSDMARIALLAEHGGVWMDVGILLFRSLDDICWSKIEDPSSPVEVCGFSWYQDDQYMIMESYFLACRRQNPFFKRVKAVILEIWKNRNAIDGIAKHALLLGSKRHSPYNFLFVSCPPHLTPGPELDEICEKFSDYLFCCLAMDCVRRIQDPKTGWNGGEYYRDSCMILDARSENGLPHWKLDWDAQRLWALWCLPADDSSNSSSDDSTKARQLLLAALQNSCLLKLDHNEHMPMEHLGNLWKDHPETDCAPGTWAGLLREASTRNKQRRELMPVPQVDPNHVGPKITTDVI
ncbi:capsular polysaccharide synthesis protein-domain-containing protein [Penicillium frequentans]|uniref:Capsular polysaccharide synthesis protein-domain-containing protein n=1 Tax=Penicillium frequentans TaxID=3151616 RepID=A0AAD6CVR8_9EURO|nr:capsular polysaccharide synthesis protein-domain-containing protein [Penicillium glabrum]